MRFSKRQWIFSGVVCVVVVIAALGWLQYAKAPASSGVSNVASSSVTAHTSAVASSTEPIATTTIVQSFPIDAADSISSWTFKGAYAGNDTLIVQANADIAHLTSLIGKGQYDDYDLYLGIGNDDNLLGNGKGAYQNYSHSISIHPNKGLAYTNLGHLMDELGAYHTVADAYAKAVAVEPSVLEYHIERLNFLTRQFPTDTALITAAFADASKQFGDDASILSIEAQWFAGQGRYADAIKAWQTVEALSPGENTSAIDAEIAQLKAKQ
ncbi:MAG: hypothetical protein ABSB00_02560 [Minisyncoccia bacterium]